VNPGLQALDGGLVVRGCDVLRIPPRGEAEVLAAQDITVVGGAGSGR
jgi:5-methylthioadenosine/S-adenosylhomocysteine deaminase